VGECAQELVLSRCLDIIVCPCNVLRTGAWMHSLPPCEAHPLIVCGAQRLCVDALSVLQKAALFVACHSVELPFHSHSTSTTPSGIPQHVSNNIPIAIQHVWYDLEKAVSPALPTVIDSLACRCLSSAVEYQERYLGAAVREERRGEGVDGAPGGVVEGAAGAHRAGG
jgi:hypothetical protein